MARLFIRTGPSASKLALGIFIFVAKSPCRPVESGDCHRSSEGILFLGGSLVGHQGHIDTDQCNSRGFANMIPTAVRAPSGNPVRDAVRTKMQKPALGKRALPSMGVSLCPEVIWRWKVFRACAAHDRRGCSRFREKTRVGAFQSLVSTSMQLTLEIIAWAALVIGLLCGPFGAFIPVVPGSVLPVMGALIHKLILPGMLSWWTIFALALIMLLERVVDFVGTLIGAKWAGATRWGLFGAAAGGIVGLFFAPFGLLLGPIIGAFAGEIVFAQRGLQPSIKSSVGAGVGYGISLAARLALSLLMIMIVLFDLYLYYISWVSSASSSSA